MKRLNKIDMAALTVIGLMLVAQDAFAGKIWGEYHVGSKHAKATYEENGIRKEFNEKNTGGGLSYELNNHIDITGGFFRNSFNKNSMYAGIDVHTAGMVRVGVAAGRITGYKDTPVNTDWIVTPNVTFGNGRVRTRVGLIPTETKVLTLTVGIAF